MPVLTCPACEGPLKVPEGASGLIHCPRCKELVGIPAPPRPGAVRAGPPPGFWEGVTQTQIIAAAVAGGLALGFFFVFCCCGGFVLPNWLWGGH